MSKRHQQNPTNHDLHIMLTEIRGDIKAILQEQFGHKEWQENHDIKDTERFNIIHKRIDGLNKYATSVAVVSGAIGASISYIWKKLGTG